MKNAIQTLTPVECSRWEVHYPGQDVNQGDSLAHFAEREPAMDFARTKGKINDVVRRATQNRPRNFSGPADMMELGRSVGEIYVNRYSPDRKHPVEFSMWTVVCKSKGSAEKCLVHFDKEDDARQLALKLGPITSVERQIRDEPLKKEDFRRARGVIHVSSPLNHEDTASYIRHCSDSSAKAWPADSYFT